MFVDIPDMKSSLMSRMYIFANWGKKSLVITCRPRVWMRVKRAAEHAFMSMLGSPPFLMTVVKMSLIADRIQN